MQQDMCVSSSSQQLKRMPAGTQYQQKTRLEFPPAPVGLISMVNIFYSCKTISFNKNVATCCSLSLEVVILAICCASSTVASEHPCIHENSSAHRQLLRSSDGTGARHQVSFPHVGQQPLPVLQLPSWGHAGERGAVNLQQGTCWGLPEFKPVEQIVMCFVWCFWRRRRIINLLSLRSTCTM